MERAQKAARQADAKLSYGVTPAMVAAARKVLWDSGALKYEMRCIDDQLVTQMLEAAQSACRCLRS